MSVLLTGGAGFIGSHICVELLEAGEDVALLDNFSNSKRDVPQRIMDITGRGLDLVDADLRDTAGLRRVFEKRDISAVIHLAGLKAVGESVEKPLLYYENNVGGSISLFNAMAEAGCRNIVFSSSATVYGNCPDIPYKEHYPLSATNPYGRTKIAIEQILGDLYASDNSWRVSILRYFNPVGAHKSGKIGEDPEGIPNNLMPFIAQVASGKLPRLYIYGGDYDTVDGTGVRDYLHVSDLALGHLAALNYIRQNPGLEAVNLGTGRGHSVLEMLRAFERASGRAIPYEIAPRRAGDIAEFYADPSKAKKLFGWEAALGIDEMCADTWRFVQNGQAL